jgi:hypothetical protein
MGGEKEEDVNGIISSALICSLCGWSHALKNCLKTIQAVDESVLKDVQRKK